MVNEKHEKNEHNEVFYDNHTNSNNTNNNSNNIKEPLKRQLHQFNKSKDDEKKVKNRNKKINDDVEILKQKYEQLNQDYKLLKKEFENLKNKLMIEQKEKEELTKEKNEFIDVIQRLKKDFENYKSRVEKFKNDERVRLKADLLKKLLGVIDQFELAISHIDEFINKKTKNRQQDHEFLQHLSGITIIFNNLKSLIEDFGVKSFEDIGESFNPARHVVSEVMYVDDKTKDNKILECVQKGYEVDGIVIKEAKVKVAKYKPSDPNNPNNPDPS